MNQWLVFLGMVIATMLGGVGALFIKLGAPAFRLHIPSLLRNYKFIFGGFLYLLSAVLYLYLLQFMPLAIAYPLTSMSYIWVTILSAKYLKEEVDAWRGVGIAAIIVGIILLNIR
jgi:drug/metabolite transporter (DMT)-like permease